ncbi:MAG: DUF3179 domain-containing protein, partial [Verrucomicrobiales bacterium]|nr:DUF3179 domain-containing protein [Verrucomicrobiales bacterium]
MIARLGMWFSIAAVVLAAIAVFPGSLGFLAFTHEFTATAAGAFFAHTLAWWIWLIGLGLLGAALCSTRIRRANRIATALGVCGFAVISAYGFLMHTSFLFRPVKQPEYVTLEEAIRRFGEKEPVIGVIGADGAAFAYVARLARRPHVVFQPEGAPFIMSHCVLSNSSMAYRAGPEFRPEDIKISSVLANNLVFYEAGTHCSFQQIYNASMDRSRTLASLPTITTTLSAWQRLYPEAKVWVRAREWRDTFYLKLLARASVIDQNNPDLVYPLVRPADPRLPLKAHVMGVMVKGDSRAYPAGLFREHRLVADTVGDEPVVFFA